MAVDVSRIPNNNKFDPVREAILDLQTSIEDTGAAIGNGTLTINTSGALTGSGTFTANQTGPSTITIGIDDSSYLTEEVNDLTASVTWANVPDANITQSSVTQHQAALSITESQISDLQSYLIASDLDDYLLLTETGEQTISGDIVISGDLTVSGETTYINTNHLNIGDNIIQLNADIGGSTAPTEDAGFYVNRGNQPDASFLWDEDDDRFSTYSNALQTASLYIGTNLFINTSRQVLASSTISSTVPYFTFSGDSNTGVGRATNNKVSLIAEGTKALEASNTGVSITGDLEVGGTFTADSVTFPNDIITSADFSTTDNRFKLTLTQSDSDTIEASLDDVVLSAAMDADYVPYVSTAGGDGDTTNAILSQSWLKFNSNTLELGASDPVSHEVRYARFLWQSGSNDKISTVYGARDITASIQYLGGSTTSKIEFTTGSSGGRIQFNDEYTFPATDGTSGQVLTTNGSGDLSWADASGGGDLTLQDVTDNGASTTNSVTVNGLTSNGNIVAEDAEVHVGDVSGDSWTRIKHAQADGYGFDWTHDNATVIVNEQGTTNEALVLGDTNTASTDSGLFGISYSTDGGSNWTKKLDLRGNGDLYVGSSGTTKVLTTADEGSGNGIDADTVDGQHASAFASASHNHDGDYLKLNSRLQANASTITSSSVTIWDVSQATDDPSGAADGLLTTLYWDSSNWAVQQYHDFHTNDLYLRSKQNGTWMSTWDRVFHDTYHPNADKWTNARTLTLNGDASGSVLWDGSANATLTVTVANDSHSHSNYVTTTGTEIRSGNLELNGTNTNGNYNQAPIEIREINKVTNNQSAYAYAPAIAWHWGGRKQMQMRLHSDGHLYVDGSNYGQSKVWTAGNDGSGSGLDADTVDGIQGSQIWKKGADIGGSQNLNNYTSDGYYHQNSNANATSGSNYPANKAGMLSVVSDGVMVYQTYHQYDGNAYYHRSYYNGTWYAWRKVWTNGNDGSGSGLDADTVDGLQASQFLRSDASDTMSGTLTVNGYSYINPSSTVALLLGRVGGVPTIKANTDDGGHLMMDSNGGVVGLNWYNSNNVVLAQGGGNVSIGSSTASHKLDVHGNIGMAEYLYHRDDTNTYLRLRADDLQLVAGGRQVLRMDEGTDPDKLVLGDSSTYTYTDGAIAVGHSAPSGGDYTGVVPKLHVKGADTSGSYTAVARFQAGNDSNNTGAAILINHSNDRGLVIKAGRKDSDREVAYFDLVGSSGATNNMLTMGKYGNDYRVGIKTSSPTQDFHVAGTGEFAGAVRITESGTAQNLLMGNQDSGGTNKPAMIQGVNGYIRIGYGNSWSGEGGTFTPQMTFANGQVTFNSTNIYVPNIYLDNALFHNGDTNTYIQFHANDQWRVVTGGAERLEVNNTNTTIQNNLVMVGYVRGNGQQLVLNAGETHSYATGQTNELVYINAEGGLQVNSSPDNWSSGWAGRKTTTINDTSGNSYFPNDIYVADQIIHTGDTDTYMQFNAANTWRVVTGGTERFSVTSDVYVKGATDLNISGTSRRLNFTAGTGTVRTTTANNLILQANNVTRQTLSTGGYSEESGSYRAPIFYDSDNTSYYLNAASTSRLNQTTTNYVNIASNAAYAVRFWGGSHNYSIRMSQSSNSTYGGRVSGETTSDYNMYFTMAGGTNRGFVFRSSNSASSCVAGIDASGTIRTISDVIAYASSDKRLKDNITPIDNPIDKVQKISGVTFDWNDKQDTYEHGKHDVGVIAQEIEEVLPEVVDTRENGYKAVKYEKIVPLLIEAIKEQQKQIDELKKLINP